MKKKRWRTCIFLISQILLSQARILDPSFFENNNTSDIVNANKVNSDNEAQSGDDKLDEVSDVLNFIQSFLTSVTQPPSAGLKIQGLF